jgi:hypothetical protein
MKSEPSKCVGLDSDGEPASPTAPVGVVSAGQVYPDFIVVERHPVDAALTQSSPRGRQGRRASGQVLVGRDDDPL